MLVSSPVLFRQPRKMLKLSPQLRQEITGSRLRNKRIPPLPVLLLTSRKPTDTKIVCRSWLKRLINISNSLKNTPLWLTVWTIQPCQAILRSPFLPYATPTRTIQMISRQFLIRKTLNCVKNTPRVNWEHTMKTVSSPNNVHSKIVRITWSLWLASSRPWRMTTSRWDTWLIMPRIRN